MIDTNLFFRVWGVYRAHWGIDEQDAICRKHTAKLLKERLIASSKMRALCYMHHILDVMWGMNLFTRPDEVMDSVRDMAEACLGEEFDETAHTESHPADRIRDNIHHPPPVECQNVCARQWETLKRPHLQQIDEESIYRVSALIALI